jgi:competence protein ComEA
MVWNWPLGTRAMLAGVVIVAALGLAGASRGVSSTPGSPVIVPNLILDPNTAPARILTVLPHFGPTLARRLVEARSEQPFSSLDDLRARVRGIGPVTLARIAPYLRIPPPSGRSIPENIAGTDGAQPARKPKTVRRKAIRTKSIESASPQPRLTASRKS